jgi:hypothetical protein
LIRYGTHVVNPRLPCEAEQEHADVSSEPSEGGRLLKVDRRRHGHAHRSGTPLHL